MTLRLRLVSLATLFLISIVSPARGGWNPDGATILSTTSHLAPVAACNDGGFGTFVVWQEAASPGAAGVLRALHVLPSGDVDPSWPAAGALVSGTSVARTMLGALPDHEGGFYVWWKAGQALVVNRMLNAAVASGWPANGRSLGIVHSTSPGPSLIEDGAHGFYAAWAAGTFDLNDAMQVMAVHLGPANTGAGGWSGGAHAVVPVTGFSTVEQWPQLALAPDGGFFLAWASRSSEPETQPSAFWLDRFTTAGLKSSGWPVAGLNIGPFDADPVGVPPVQSSMIGLAPDGRGGVFLVTANPTAYDGYSLITVDVLLHRRESDGDPAADWPAGGRVVPTLSGYGGMVEGSPDGSLRVLADGRDGAIVGNQALFTDSPLIMEYSPCTATGQWNSWRAGADAAGHEAFASGDGGLYVGAFSPDGPFNPFDSIAFISVNQAPGGDGFSEYHDQPVLLWYGDIALASSGDGGAVFYWSQVRDRFGLFARRLTPGGEVTAVGDARVTAGLGRVFFTRGAGVRARVQAVAGMRLDLYDVTGRRLATTRIDEPGATEVLLPGTAQLSAGLYFARLSGVGVAQTGRVVVAQ